MMKSNAGAVPDLEKGTVSAHDVCNNRTNRNCNRGFVYQSWKARNAVWSALGANVILACLSINAVLALLSVNAIGSLLSANSVFSAFSINSAFSFGSHASAFAIGCDRQVTLRTAR